MQGVCIGALWYQFIFATKFDQVSPATINISKFLQFAYSIFHVILPIFMFGATIIIMVTSMHALKHMDGSEAEDTIRRFAKFLINLYTKLQLLKKEKIRRFVDLILDFTILGMAVTFDQTFLAFAVAFAMITSRVYHKIVVDTRAHLMKKDNQWEIIERLANDEPLEDVITDLFERADKKVKS